MNQSDARRIFFYAMNEAGMYDTTIEWVAPYYHLMHEMMLRLAVESVQIIAKAPSKPLLALDIGSGTGAEAISLLKKIPDLHLIGLDLCGPMNQLFKEKATKATVSKDRYRLIEADIVDPAAKDTIRALLHEAFGADDFQLIISAFTIHHIEKEQKAQVFRMIHDLLEPGGVFLFGDLFNYADESSWLTETIFTWEVDRIVSNFKQAAEDADHKGDTYRGEQLRSLEGKWVSHYMNDNKLDGVTTQLSLLRDAGFSEVGNPFRYWQVGLIWARKSD